MLALAVSTILIGALETAGGAQELYWGIVGNGGPVPVLGGTAGAVAGALLVAAGIAMLRRSPRARELALAAAGLALPVFVAIGVVVRMMGAAALLVGFGISAALLVWALRAGRRPLAA